SYSHPFPYDRFRGSILALDFEIPAFLSSGHFPCGYTFTKPADSEWNTPPAGVAEGMLAPQYWLPYEGPFKAIQQECGGQRIRGLCVNVTDAPPELATMRAMVQSEELEVDDGRTTIRLGAPERLSFSQISDKFRRLPADNITVIS